MIEGTSGDDNLSGSDASEVFNGGQGNDTIEDSGGDDTYIWNTGDGSDLITSNYSWNAQSDTIAFGAGIGPLDVIIRHELDGQDRISATYNGGGSIAVDGVVSGDNREVLVRFADGTIWDEATLLRKADANQTLVTGTSGSDTLNGSGRGDLIDGLAGNDTLYGDGGSDTYVYRSGDGNDVVRDYGSSLDNDVLNFVDLSPSQVSLQRVNDQFGNGNDLLITDLATSQTVRVAGQFNDSGIESILFSDNSSVNRAEILSSTSGIHGTSGADNFSISWSGFNLTPGGGNDVITVNRSGGGTIEFAAGDGHDTLQSNLGYGYARTDTLDLLGLNPSDVTLTRSGNGLSGDKLTITVNSTGDTFTALWQFNGYDEQAGLDQIHFADGTLWSRADISNHVFI